MKRIMKLMTLVAVAAAGLTACQNNFEEITNEDIAKSVVVKFESEEATRTSVDTSGDEPLFSWSEAESFVALEQTDALAVATSVNYKLADGKAHIDAEFALNGGKDEYRYAVVYPASGYVAAESINSVTLALPAEQSMVSDSYDPNADLMVSLPVTTDAQPTETQLLRFTRLAAVAKMSISNLNIGAGEQIERVEFTADGKALAGEIVADLDDPHAFAVSKGVSTVSVAATTSDAVYFNVLPTTLEAGDTYSVAVVTDKKVYAKAGSILDGKSLVFEAGEVSRFNVNMTDVEAIDKWTLVRDASTLKEGDVVAIVAKDYDKALSTKLYSNASETSTSAKRGLADVVKIGNFIKGGEDLQQLTLMTGVAANTFSFYDEARGKFLVSSTTGSTHLINQVYCDVNTSFAITIDDNAVATITNTEGEYKGNLLRYNSNGYFVSNQNSSTVYKDVCVYRLEGAVGEIPTVAAVVTVPDSDEAVTIAEEGASEATTIEDVVFNYVGTWTISVSDNAEWLDIVYDAVNTSLTYTAEVNTGAKREATATITASLEGEESLTWSFNIVQKGAPQEITIAEFMTKDKDENATYKITGRVTEATSSSSGTYKLSDNNGNIATVTYVYTDAGGKVYGDDSIGVKVGDVMTVTTVVTSTTKGKGGSSSYHTIYKGHYGFSASVGIAADYTGGSVAIEVATYSNGDIVVPEAVVATMADNDYAKFEYDGGNSATVTFDSENTTTDAREAVVTFTYGMTDVVVVAEQGINPANKRGYELVTDASTLAVGDEVIIVAKNADRALACPTKTSDTKFPSAVIEKTGNVIYDIEDAGVQTFTLMSGNSDGTMSFEFTYNNTVYYPYYSSGLKMRTSINDAASWAININEDGEALISTISSSSTYLIKFNSATSSLTFTCYKDSAANATKAENAVAIYKKQL